MKRGPKMFHKIMLPLNRAQVDFLDKIGKDILFSKGKKMPRVEVIRSLIDAARQASAEGKDFTVLEELNKRMVEQASEELRNLKKEGEEKTEAINSEIQDRPVR